MQNTSEKIGIRNLAILALAGIIIVLTAALAQSLGTIRQMQRENARAAARVMLYPPHVLPADATNAIATGGAQ